MKLNATIEIRTLELRHIIEDYLARNGVMNVSDQDIHFVVEKVEMGDQRDPWQTYELTKANVCNVRVGND